MLPAGQYGVTSALQKGHGLSAVSQGGGGAAVTALKGPWSLTAGQFMSCNYEIFKQPASLGGLFLWTSAGSHVS